MTDELFRKDSYLQECDAEVVAVEGAAIVVDRTVFYPLGGEDWTALERFIDLYLDEQARVNDAYVLYALP